MKNFGFTLRCPKCGSTNVDNIDTHSNNGGGWGNNCSDGGYHYSNKYRCSYCHREFHVRKHMRFVQTRNDNGVYTEYEGHTTIKVESNV